MVFGHVGFFCSWWRGTVANHEEECDGMNQIKTRVAQPGPVERDGEHDGVKQFKTSVAQQIAAAASAFEQRRTGRLPKSVTVVLTDDTLVITFHGALSE